MMKLFILKWANGDSENLSVKVFWTSLHKSS